MMDSLRNAAPPPPSTALSQPVRLSGGYFSAFFQAYHLHMRTWGKVERIGIAILWPVAVVSAAIVLRHEPGVLEAWAWPVVVLFVVVILKSEVTSLIGRLNVFSGPAGIKAEFTKQAELLDDQTSELVPNVPDKLAVPSGDRFGSLGSDRPDGEAFVEKFAAQMELLEEAQINPKGAVFRSWQILERIAFRESYEHKMSFTPEVLVALLVGQHAIDPEFSRIVRELRFTKDLAALWHIPMNTSDADGLVKSAWRLAVAMDKALKEQGLELPPFGLPSGSKAESA
jgi:hypothetical protein